MLTFILFLMAAISIPLRGGERVYRNFDFTYMYKMVTVSEDICLRYLVLFT